MEDSGAGAPRVGVSQPRRGGTTWHHLAMASTLSSRLKQALVEEGLLCQLGGEGRRGLMAWRRWRRRRDWCRRRRRGPGGSGSGGTKAIDFPLTEGQVPWPLGRSCSARTACCRGALLPPRGKSPLGHHLSVAPLRARGLGSRSRANRRPLGELPLRGTRSSES